LCRVNEGKFSKDLSFKGMEDVLVLDKMLNDYPEDRLKAFQEYTKHRAPDAHAMCDLAMYNYIEVWNPVSHDLM